MDGTIGTNINDQSVTIDIPNDIVNLTSQNQPDQIATSDDTQKRAGGRPCEYCKDKDVKQKIAEEYLRQCYHGKPQQIPFIEELAILLDCDDETITLWAKKKIKDTENKDIEDSLEHPEFSAIVTKLKMIQKLLLMKRILGRYNPTGAISLLRWHHGMIETQKQILAGEKAEPLEIRIVEDNKQVN